jgi:hypothetical protein
MFQSCAQFWTLVERFRAGSIALADFGHRQHLAVACAYASTMSSDRALEAFRTDLLRFISPFGHERKYHESVTRFWLHLARHYVEVYGAGRCTALVANDFVERFADKTLIERHYTPARLWSAAARAAWMEPDLLPLPPIGDGSA